MNWTDEIVQNNDPQKLVGMQLEEWAATDPALAETYDKSRLEDCWDWIVEKARELLGGDSGAVWHGQVFRWARDYFVDRVFEKKEQEEKEEQERAKKQRAERPKKRVARTKTKRKAAPRDADSPEALAMDAVSVPAEAPAALKPEAAPVPGIQLDLFAEASR